MLKRYLLCGFLGALLAIGGCDKSEEEITTPSGADRNWFVIPDKPGEFNQLVYRIYQETGMPIFVNDTLGEEYYAKDAQGNPILRTESFNLSYVLFGTYSNYTDTLPSPFSIVQSENEQAKMKAAELIRDRVLPYVPKVGEARPRCYFLVDSLNEVASVAFGWRPVYSDVKNKSLYVAMKGVILGQLCDILTMTEEETDLWCGRAIAAKVSQWMTDNMDLTEWVAITNEGKSSGSYYEGKYTPYYAEYNFDVLQDFGMFAWRLDIPEGRVVVSQIDDMIEYIARVYVYRGRETEFLEKYADYDKVIRKYNMMREFVRVYEEIWDLK